MFPLRDFTFQPRVRLWVCMPRIHILVSCMKFSCVYSLLVTCSHTSPYHQVTPWFDFSPYANLIYLSDMTTHMPHMLSLRIHLSDMATQIIFPLMNHNRSLQINFTYDHVHSFSTSICMSFHLQAQLLSPRTKILLAMFAKGRRSLPLNLAGQLLRPIKGHHCLSIRLNQFTLHGAH